MCTFKAGDDVEITANGRTIVGHVDCAMDVSRLETGTQEFLCLDDLDLRLARKPSEHSWHTESGPHLLVPITVQLVAV